MSPAFIRPAGVALFVAVAVTGVGSSAADDSSSEPLITAPDESAAPPSADTVVAADAGPAVDASSRAEVISSYRTMVHSSLDEPIGFTGNVNACQAGTTSAAYQQATLDVINYARGLAGVPTVGLDASLNAATQQAALMMDAANVLSHSPTPGWPCYSAAGTSAAAKSNLALGTSGPASILAYLDDAGTGNDAAGHRWWLLAPQQTSFGTGSTPRANALWVLGASSNAQAGNGGWVAWPPPGWVPDTFLPESSHRWSLTRHDGAASLAGASVSATVGGTAASVRIVHRTADRLVWELDGPGLYTGLSEPIVSVTVAGISGGASSYSYDVRVLRAPFFNTTVFMSNELASGPATDKTGFYEPGLDLMSGDFDIDGRTDIAQRHGNRFELVSASGADLGSIGYGRAGDEVFIGDWNCDGVETFAVRRGNVFHVKNTIASGPADIVIGYGKPGDEVFVGDWDGNGCDTLAVRRGNVFFVRNSVTSGPADTIFGYGKAGDEVFVGDWNDDRRDTFAVHRGATFFLRDDLKSGAAQRIFDFGEPDDVVLVGDWDGDRIDTFAVAR